jgi:hypothetical protein
MGTTLTPSTYIDTDQLSFTHRLWPLSPRQLGGVSRFEALLPHGQLRLTFSEMQLPIIH